MKYNAVILGLALSASSFAADTLPSGVVLDGINDIGPARQQELIREREERLQQRNLKPQNEPLVEEKKDEQDVQQQPTGPTFLLKSVRFSESEYLTQDDMRSVVVPLLEKQTSFNDLQKLVQSINVLYKSKGVYTATAVLPQQKIKEGVVFIRLVEGKLGQLKVEDNQYTSSDFVRGWLGNTEQVESININVLEQEVLRFNRINDQRLQAELHAGEAFGLTDILIRVSEPERNQTYVFFDNYGVTTSGKTELGLLYQRQQLFIDGDRSTVHALHAGDIGWDFTKGTQFWDADSGVRSLNLGYNAPIAQSGWRLGGSVSSTYTDILNGDAKDLNVEGKSERISIDSSYMAYSSTHLWADLLLGVNHTWSTTDISGFDFTKNRVMQYQMGGQLNWLGNFWQLSMRQFIHFSTIEDTLASNDNQDAHLYKGDLTAVVQIPTTSFYGILKGQWQVSTQDELAGALSYSLGGPTSVRGYQPGFITGDEGFYYNLEAHYNGLSAWGHTFDMYVFKDDGEVTSANPTERLVAAGAGLNISGSSKISLDLTAAKEFNQVTPDQDEWMVFARLTCQCF